MGREPEEPVEPSDHDVGLTYMWRTERKKKGWKKEA